jgi:hypothetical protein
MRGYSRFISEHMPTKTGSSPMMRARASRLKLTESLSISPTDTILRPDEF